MQVADQITARSRSSAASARRLRTTTPARSDAVSGARFGNMGCITFAVPAFFNTNAGAVPAVRLNERFNLQFRAEGLNVTNTPQLQNPNVDGHEPGELHDDHRSRTRRSARFGSVFRLAF